MRFTAARFSPQIQDSGRRCSGSRIQQGFQGFAVAAGNKIIERGCGRRDEIENELLHDY